ncbi:MAG: peptidylprolyl isomerase, partial [Notoacmeibacter sp.]|nr:peptidylprolyl isomerase [Notoacmeibacter sp.]
MTFTRRLAAAALAASMSLTALPALAAKLVITLKDGDVVINLRDDLAPKHVERIVALAKAGEYDNVAFHRVIDGF